MGCPKLKYNLSAEPRLRCVYNAANGEENRVVYPKPIKPVIWRIYTAERKAVLFLKYLIRLTKG